MVGVLKGADPVCNLVLDETVEFLRGGSEKRTLGIVIARGQTVLSICKEDGFEPEIENPYAQA